MKLIVRTLHNNSRDTGVELPKLFVPHAPDTPEFETWLEEIREYRRLASRFEKQQAKAKARKAMA